VVWPVELALLLAWLLGLLLVWLEVELDALGLGLDWLGSVCAATHTVPSTNTDRTNNFRIVDPPESRTLFHWLRSNLRFTRGES
jgi:hypothetical protein